MLKINHSGTFLAALLLAGLFLPAETSLAEMQAKVVEEQVTEEVQSTQPADYVGWMELSGPLVEGVPRYAWVGEDERGTTLRRVLSEIKKVEENDRYTGLVIYLDQPMLSVTQAQEIDEAIQGVRASGKKVIAFAESYTVGSYLLACSADMIVLQKKGSIILSGLGVEEMYLAGLLEKIGVKADFIQVGEYKGAAESLTNTGPSEEWSQNIDKLLDDYYQQIVGRIAERRSLGLNQVEKIFADSWTMKDEQYVERQVVDAVAERDLISVTEKAFGDNFVWSKLLKDNRTEIQFDNPFAMFSMIFKPQKTKVVRPSIALVTAKGTIHSGESGGDGLFSSESIGSKTFVKALGKARDNDLIKGVVLRIDSPGGSALASEVIWQAIREVAAKKPVYVSVGRMAASGGYYMACAGNQVYVSPMSIVGSIGVIGGKITLGGLYEKIGISIHRRTRGPMGDLFNSVEPFTEEQRAKLLTAMTNIYEQFTDRVEIGRGDRVKDIELIARGRLFTGRQAIRNGMADRIGGVNIALAALASEVGLEDGKYDVVNLPEPKGFQEFLDDMFGGEAETMLQRQAVIATAKAVIGNQRWQAVSAVMSGLMLLKDEPVLTVMPQAIVID